MSRDGINSLKIVWFSDGLNQIVHRNGHLRRDKRGAGRSPDPAAQTAWIDQIKNEVSVLATNIVGKESKKVWISADGGIVEVSDLQGGMASRNSPCPCDGRKI
jgi:hypothetical protein